MILAVLTARAEFEFIPAVNIARKLDSPEDADRANQAFQTLEAVQKEH